MTARYLTFTHEGRTRYGRMEGDRVVDLGHLAARWADLRAVIAAGALAALDAEAGPEIDAAEITFEPPIPTPEKIICVGVNYPDRNAEYRDGSELPKYMSLFPRFPRSFTGHGQPLIRPPESHMLDYEGEVAIVIGRPGRRIARQAAWAHIAAITIANEGTIRDWVRHAKFNVTQGKNWDRSGALGPFIVPFADPAQLADIRITTTVNGELRQDDRTSRMMFPIPQQIAYISTFTTLMPGDIILTGTPTGAGARLDPPRFLAPGDVVEVAVEGVGVLRNTVEDEPCP